MSSQGGHPTGSSGRGRGALAPFWGTWPGALALVLLALGTALYMGQVSAILASAGAGSGGGSAPSRLREGGDAYSLWFGVRALAAGGDPYSAEVARQAQAAIWGRPINDALHAFVYPLPALLWYLPGLWLDLAAATAYLRLLVLLATAGVVLLGLRLIGVAPGSWAGLAAAALMAGLVGVHDQYALGQNAALSVAPALGAWLLYRAGRPTLAGLLLPLALIKPHYVVLLAVGMGLHALADRRRRGFLLGAATSTALLTLGGLLVQPDWPARWLGAMRLNMAEYPGSYLSGLLGDGEIVIWAVRAALIVPVAACWWRHRACPATAPWGAPAVVASLAVGVVALGINPGHYNAIAFWPALALLLLGPVGRPPGRAARLIRALNVAWLVLLPLGGAAVALLWQLLPAPRAAFPLATAAVVVAFAAALQGLLVAAWAVERCLPARPRAAVPGAR